MKGEFETHITVCLEHANEAIRLRKWAQERAFKFVHIILAEGKTPSQPMLTRHGEGTLTAELAIARRIVLDLREAGFETIRIKLETTIDNPSVGNINNPDCYFESHVKLLVPPSGDLQSLANVAQLFGGHLSRNAFRTRDDGACERFVTQRSYRTGVVEVLKALDSLLSALTPLGYEVLEIEKEYVVFDNNLSLDDGWLRTQ